MSYFKKRKLQQFDDDVLNQWINPEPEILNFNAPDEEKNNGQQGTGQPQPQQQSTFGPGQHPFHVGRMNLPDPEYMSEVPTHLQNKEVPGFPTTILLVGEPGSGKSNLLMTLLTGMNFWNGFFDTVYLLGPTVQSDQMYQHIIVPDDQIVTKAEEFIPKLKLWVEKQIDAVKQNPKTAPRALFVFEDFTSYREDIQNKPEFIRCFTAIRHHKATSIVNIHKVKALNRTARLACRQLCIFPVQTTEIKQIYEDNGPRKLSFDDFVLVCEEAWTPDEENKKPFLYINKFSDENKRFRKCFTNIIDITQFEGKAKANKRELMRPSKRRKTDENGDTPMVNGEASPQWPSQNPLETQKPQPQQAPMGQGTQQEQQQQPPQPTFGIPQQQKQPDQPLRLAEGSMRGLNKTRPELDPTREPMKKSLMDVLMARMRSQAWLDKNLQIDKMLRELDKKFKK
jgi:Poxvirus A32 protein